jgi:hypothetical protein
MFLILCKFNENKSTIHKSGDLEILFWKMERNCLIFVEIIGGLAHLARALAWQARGGRFESDILHLKHCNITVPIGAVFLLKEQSKM